MISIQPAGPSEEDIAENGPEAILLEADTPEDRKVLAMMLETMLVGLPSLTKEE